MIGDDPAGRPAGSTWRSRWPRRAMSDGRRIILGCLLVVTCSVLPVFMVGAMSDPIRAELGFGESRLGIAVALYFLTSAVLSGLSGRVVERLGATLSMRLACFASAVGLVVIAILATNWGTLVAGLMLASVAMAVGTPAANLALVRGVSGRRMGLAFGLKQASAPLGTLLSGLAVPVLAVTLGWRVGLLSGAVFCLLSILMVPSVAGAPARSQQGTATRGLVRSSRSTLVTMSVAFALGNIAANSVGVFLVPTAVAYGVDIAVAGIWLSVGSVAGICTRILVGWQADRGAGAPFRTISIMLLLGGAAYALLSLGEPALVLPGGVLGFAFGWGWNGLFSYGVVQENPAAPAVATGVTHSGGYVGAALGPLLFGYLAEHWSFGAAWVMTGAAATMGAAMMYLAHRLILRQDADPRAVRRLGLGRIQ